MPLRPILLAVFLAFGLAPAASAEDSIYFSPNGTAIHGYDAVAYFSEGAPVPGQADIAIMWKGVMWYFANAEHLAMFEANPRAYAPQFGGYCAYSVARGSTSTTDPQVWRIVKGKLYLVHSSQVARLWERDLDGNIAMAEANWPAVLRD